MQCYNEGLVQETTGLELDMLGMLTPKCSSESCTLCGVMILKSDASLYLCGETVCHRNCVCAHAKICELNKKQCNCSWSWLGIHKRSSLALFHCSHCDRPPVSEVSLCQSRGIVPEVECARLSCSAFASSGGLGGNVEGCKAPF
eukprot:6469741-Amphidinium_carterae.1